MSKMRCGRMSEVIFVLRMPACFCACGVRATRGAPASGVAPRRLQPVPAQITYGAFHVSKAKVIARVRPLC